MYNGLKSARIMIVGDAPSVEAKRANEPFAGQTLGELTRMLADAGIDIRDAILTNVVHEAAPANDVKKFFHDKGCKKPVDLVHAGLDMLHKLIEEVKPELIIPLGNMALWALHDKMEHAKGGIAKWRGSQLMCTAVRGYKKIFPTKMLPTWHPSAVLRNWEWRYTAVRDFRRAHLDWGKFEWTVPEYKFFIRPSFDQATEWLRNLQQKLEAGPTYISVDIETRGGYMACVGFAISRLEALCVPLMCVERHTGYWDPDEEFALVLLMREILAHPNARIIGQNFLYDMQYLTKEWGAIFYPWLDTMLAHHLCWPGLPKGLDFLSALYCDYHTYWKDEGKHWDPRAHSEDEFWRYNCKDAVTTFEIAQTLFTTINRLGLAAPFDFQQNHIYRTMFRVMLRGVNINHKLRGKLTLELLEAQRLRESYVNAALGRPLNPRSPQQLQDLFYWQLHLPPQRNREGRITCDEEALVKLKKREPLVTPLVDSIIEVRSIGTSISVCAARLDNDGRMRTSYNVAGPETFRFSSSENAFGNGTNLQNISSGRVNKIAEWLKQAGPQPIMRIADQFRDAEMRKDEPEWTYIDRMETKLLSGVETGQIWLLDYDKQIYCYGFVKPNLRCLIIPDPGKVIIDVDLDRADLQIVIWEADDAEMKQMLREGVDMHKENAKVLFHLHSIAEVTHAQRQVAKIFCHATNYGGKERTVAGHCGLGVAETARMQRRWLEAHPGIERWHRNTERDLYQSRMVTNAFGYRRYYFDRLDAILPEALAWKPQSTVAIVINRGIVAVDENLPEVETLLQVHDSGTFQTDYDNWPRVQEPMNRLMRIDVPYPDPLVIPVGFATSRISWGDCE